VTHDERSRIASGAAHAGETLTHQRLREITSGVGLCPASVSGRD
jgi:hypothetical protein